MRAKPMNKSYHKNLKNNNDICPTFCPKEDKSTKVIVYSYGGEPVVLTAIRDFGDSIMVFGRDRKKALRYPRRFVFSFDKDLYKDLVEAYTRTDAVTVAELWKKARPV